MVANDTVSVTHLTVLMSQPFCVQLVVLVFMLSLQRAISAGAWHDNLSDLVEVSRIVLCVGTCFIVELSWIYVELSILGSLIPVLLC